MKRKHCLCSSVFIYNVTHRCLRYDTNVKYSNKGINLLVNVDCLPLRLGDLNKGNLTLQIGDIHLNIGSILFSTKGNLHLDLSDLHLNVDDLF